ncbi:MAG: response regulator [Magnetococcus sp. XQGC-1]
MKLKTLIIDDHPASIALLENLLAEHCTCFSATSGEEGLALFAEAHKSSEPFDVVLLDILMPDLDGIETLKRMRKIELADREVQLFGKRDGLARIIMQTSSDSPQDFMDSYLKGRCNGFILKPYSKEEIVEKVLGRHAHFA